LHRNYRCKGGEIDLVLEEEVSSGQFELVFVEVRSRGAGAWVSGVETVDFRKRLKLSRTIRYFLAGYRGRAKSLRVDLLAWDDGVWTHLRNVWL
jgi:putative endonuclease